MAKESFVTGKECFFDETEIIVSKTNLKGNLTYCNEVFLRIAGYSEKECLGKPHNMIRHPEMPRSIFYMLWEYIQDQREIFAYVKNRCKNGDHYWVLAHVTPSVDSHGNIVGYHSNRRVPDRRILENKIMPLYSDLLKTERQHRDRKQGLEAAKDLIANLLSDRGMHYDEFIATL